MTAEAITCCRESTGSMMSICSNLQQTVSIKEAKTIAKPTVDFSNGLQNEIITNVSVFTFPVNCTSTQHTEEETCVRMHEQTEVVNDN